MDPEVHRKILDLFRSGCMADEVVAALDITEQTICNWL